MATNVASFLFTIVIGLIMVPYYIRRLGPAAYGLIPLATSLTAYLGLITMSLNGAVSRYLILDIQSNNIESANRVFNTALFSVSGMALALLPVIAVLSWYAPSIFNIPAGAGFDVKLLFFLSMLSFLISVALSSFSISMYAFNRLDIQNYFNMAVLVARTLPVVILFSLFGAGVHWVGVALLFGALVSAILGVIAWRKLTPFLRVNLKNFDFKKLGELTNMSWWLTVNQVGTLLFLNTDIILVNLLFGAGIAGEYGAVMQWPMLLRTMAGVFAGVFAPTILILFSRGDRDRMILLCRKSLKFLGLGMALPIGLLCGFSGPILNLWLGPEFSKYSILLAIMCAHLSLNLAVLPLFSIQVAANKVRVPGVVTLVGGVGLLLLALILAKFTPLGVYGVALAGAVMLTLKNVIFTPLYGARILGVDKMLFLKPLAGGVIGTSLVWASCSVINVTIMPQSWIAVIVCSAAISVLYCAGAYFKATSREEKNMALSVVN